MKTKNIITLLSFAIFSFGAYKIYQTKFWEKTKLSKKEAIDVIVQSGNSKNTNNNLSSFDEAFLIAWANGILKKQSSFIYNQKKYNTIGGKSV